MSNNTATGVDFIVNSNRKYPDWIKNHSVFKEMNKIDKIFPKIGLANFSEPCEILNTQEAMAEATRLSSRIVQELNKIRAAFYVKLDASLKEAGKDRNDICCSLQSLINLISSTIYSLNFQEHIKLEDGRVVFKLRSDIFNEDNKPIFRKDEALLRVVNKIFEMVEKSPMKYDLPAIDKTAEFKSFSKVNIPNKKYTLAFSSYGDTGAWDIATVSMRGIKSCQSWDAPQSRGLIGSLSSRFVGVMYLASDQKIEPYGTKMLNRCMVRFVINKVTKKPTLFIDNMYPNENTDCVASFKKALKEKSGLDVVYSRDDYAASSQYYLPDEMSSKHLKNGETSYMDNHIEIRTHTSNIINPIVNLTETTDQFVKKISTDLDNMISLKRDAYVAASVQLDKLKAEYATAKAKWETENSSKPEEERVKFEMEAPKMDAELAEFGRGGIINLIAHCDKKHGKNSAGRVFANLILSSIMVPSKEECVSPDEYHRKYLMTFLRSPSKVKEVARQKYATGTWIKSFPKSSEKFFELIFSQMKPYFIASCKEIMKKLN